MSEQREWLGNRLVHMIIVAFRRRLQQYPIPTCNRYELAVLFLSFGLRSVVLDSIIPAGGLPRLSSRVNVRARSGRQPHLPSCSVMMLCRKEKLITESGKQSIHFQATDLNKQLLIITIFPCNL